MEGVRTYGRTSANKFGRFYTGGSRGNGTSTGCHPGRRRSIVHAEGLDSPSLYTQRQQSAFAPSHCFGHATMGVDRSDGNRRARGAGSRRRKQRFHRSARGFAPGIHGLHGGPIRRDRDRKAPGISEKECARGKEGQQETPHSVSSPATIQGRREKEDNGNRENCLRHVGCIVRRDGKEIFVGTTTPGIDRKRGGADGAGRRNSGRTTSSSEHDVSPGASGHCTAGDRGRQGRRVSLRRQFSRIPGKSHQSIGIRDGRRSGTGATLDHRRTPLDFYQ
mmetsp:Transcript_25114/g.69273  ORF Transcript_25114/g.69273 Transcript_25114/m.69273 type:complete len:277 (+) Transcript_25114:235-1065(+)